MARVARDVCGLIGRTPLVEISRLAPAGGGRIVAKLEGLNPGGSGKDRIALAMVEEGERSGRIAPGVTLIEPTVGNTGLALAMVAAARGLKLLLTLPEDAPAGHVACLRALGAQVVLTGAAAGMRGAIEEAERLAREIPESLILQQFSNAANPRVHQETTAREIWEDLEGEVDALVAGAGTGGTLSGCAAFLKERRPSVRVIAVEPAASPVLSGGEPGAHGLPGIGPGFIPRVMRLELVDEVLAVGEEEAYEATRDLAREEGILAGPSSGAVLCAARVLASRSEMAGRTIVAVFHDHGTRYAHHPVFAAPGAPA